MYLNYFDRWYDHAFLIPMKSFAALCDDRCYAGWLVSQLWQNFDPDFFSVIKVASLDSLGFAH